MIGVGGVCKFTLRAPPPQAQNVSGFTTPVVVLGMYACSATIATRGMSPAKDGEIVAASNQFYVAWKIYSTSPQSTTITQSDDGSNGMSSMYFQAN